MHMYKRHKKNRIYEAYKREAATVQFQAPAKKMTNTEKESDDQYFMKTTHFTKKNLKTNAVRCPCSCDNIEL